MLAVTAVATPAVAAVATRSPDTAATASAATEEAVGYAGGDERKAQLANSKTRTDRAIAKAERRAEARRRAKRRSSSGGGGANSTASPALEAIAACESGGNPRAVGGGGQYRGKYQFSRETWAAVGGSGDPAAASEAEQDRRAAILYAQGGAGQWPTCGS